MNMKWIRDFMAKVGLGHPPAFEVRVTSAVTREDERDFFRSQRQQIENALRPYERELAACGFHVWRSQRDPRVHVNYLDDAGRPIKDSGAALMYELSGYLKDWKVRGPGLKRKAAFENLEAAANRFMEQVREMPKHQPATSAERDTPGTSERAGH